MQVTNVQALWKNHITKSTSHMLEKTYRKTLSCLNYLLKFSFFMKLKIITVNVQTHISSNLCSYWKKNGISVISMVCIIPFMILSQVSSFSIRTIRNDLGYHYLHLNEAYVGINYEKKWLLLYEMELSH